MQRNEPLGKGYEVNSIAVARQSTVKQCKARQRL
nr:MAG TPA: hypothetical protein [Caudoviricetes sp.]